MRQTLLVMCLTTAGLVGLDVAVGAGLRWAETNGRVGSLVQYFEYGRSVPGKLARWEDNPNISGNLYDVAWRPEALVSSATRFVTEADTGPVVRTYGMSFVNRILRQAQVQNPDLQVDPHAAPAGSPNFTYAMFTDDRENRRAGDVVVLGLLSSSLPAMAAFSNATWSFEQPAPFTYPIYRPHTSEDGQGDGLNRIDPVITSLADQQALAATSQNKAQWAAQLATEDAFYSPITFGLPALDASPFARLVRRALAKSHVADVEADILSGAYPYEQVLLRMIETFAQTARADGQMPVVMLIQSNRPGDPDLHELAQPLLEEADIPYLATTQYVNPSQHSAFESDGHYTAQNDVVFARAFLELVREQLRGK